ncbi:hypothetical protein DNTS_014059 [Danionella cerebrum]|uniref:Uncharacterized protein n=1 Tax=Danionella cerebrum TaxID=2873325 RepID=A0A553NII0_9TELE|nr:hypothetical protein DNTS_014059 [Danionella translucida]
MNSSVEHEKRDQGDTFIKVLNQISSSKTNPNKDVTPALRALVNSRSEKSLFKELISALLRENISVEEMLTAKGDTSRSTELMLGKHSDKMTEKERDEVKELQSPQEADGEVSPQSANVTSSDQAVKIIQGVLDVKSGAVMSVCRAVNRGFIDQLTGLSLLEAQLITTGLVCPEYGLFVHLEDAFRKKLVDDAMFTQLKVLDEAKKCLQGAQFALQAWPAAAASEAGVISHQTAVKIIEIQLATGSLRLRQTGEILNAEQAFELGLIPEALFVQILERKYLWKNMIDPNTAEKVTLYQILQRGVFHEPTGLCLLPVKGEEEGTICLASGREIDVFTAEREGAIDGDTMIRLLSSQLFAGGIVDPKNGCKRTIEEALSNGVIDRDTATNLFSYQLQHGGIVNPQNQTRLTVDEAVQCDLISSWSSLLVLERQKAVMGLLWPKAGEILSFSSSLHQNVLTEEIASELFMNRQKISGLYIPETSEVVDIESSAQRNMIETFTKEMLKMIELPDELPDVDELSERFSSWLVMHELQIKGSYRASEKMCISDLMNVPSPSERKQLFVSYLMMNSYMDPTSTQRLLVFDSQLNRMAKSLFGLSEAAGIDEMSDFLLNSSAMGTDHSDSENDCSTSSCGASGELQIYESLENNSGGNHDVVGDVLPEELHCNSSITEAKCGFLENNEVINKVKVDENQSTKSVCDHIKDQQSSSLSSFLFPSEATGSSAKPIQYTNAKPEMNDKPEGDVTSREISDLKCAFDKDFIEEEPHPGKDLLIQLQKLRHGVYDPAVGKSSAPDSCDLYRSHHSEGIRKLCLFSDDVNDALSVKGPHGEGDERRLHVSSRQEADSSIFPNIPSIDFSSGDSTLNVAETSQSSEESSLICFDTKPDHPLSFISDNQPKSIPPKDFLFGKSNETRLGFSETNSRDFPSDIVAEISPKAITTTDNVFNRDCETSKERFCDVKLDGISQNSVSPTYMSPKDSAIRSEEVLQDITRLSSTHDASLHVACAFQDCAIDNCSKKNPTPEEVTCELTDLADVSIGPELSAIDSSSNDAQDLASPVIPDFTAKGASKHAKVYRMASETESDEPSLVSTSRATVVSSQDLGMSVSPLDVFTKDKLVYISEPDGDVQSVDFRSSSSFGAEECAGTNYQVDDVNVSCENTGDPGTSMSEVVVPVQSFSWKPSEVSVIEQKPKSEKKRETAFSDLNQRPSESFQPLSNQQTSFAEGSSKGMELSIDGLCEEHPISSNTAEFRERDRVEELTACGDRNSLVPGNESNPICAEEGFVKSANPETAYFKINKQPAERLVSSQALSTSFPEARSNLSLGSTNSQIEGDLSNDGLKSPETSGITTNSREPDSKLCDEHPGYSDTAEFKERDRVEEVTRCEDNISPAPNSESISAEERFASGVELNGNSLYLLDYLQRGLQKSAVNTSLLSPFEVVLRASNSEDPSTEDILTNSSSTKEKLNSTAHRVKSPLEASADLSSDLQSILKYSSPSSPVNVDQNQRSTSSFSQSQSGELEVYGGAHPDPPQMEIDTAKDRRDLRHFLSELIQMKMDEACEDDTQRFRAINNVIEILQQHSRSCSTSHPDPNEKTMDPDILMDLKKQKGPTDFETLPSEESNYEPKQQSELLEMIRGMLSSRDQRMLEDAASTDEGIADDVFSSQQEDAPNLNLTGVTTTVSPAPALQPCVFSSSSSRSIYLQLNMLFLQRFSTQNYLECVGRLQDHCDTIEDMRNDLLAKSRVGDDIEELHCQLLDIQSLEAQIATLPAMLTADLSIAEKLLNSADASVPVQIHQDLVAVFLGLQSSFSDVCNLSTERSNAVMKAIDKVKLRLEVSYQELLTSLHKVTAGLQHVSEKVSELETMDSDVEERIKSKMRGSEAVEEDLSTSRQLLDEVAFDIQNFISEHAQFLPPTHSRHLLRELSTSQRSFKTLMDRRITQRQTLDVLLRICEDEMQQKAAAEKQKEFSEKLQELCEDLDQTEKRLSGNQQQAVRANTVADLQQSQQEQQALQKDLQANASALSEVISSTQKFLEENRSKLSPEQTSALERTLEELKNKANTLNQRAEESRKDLEKILTSAIRQENEKVAAVEQLEESKSRIEGLLGWISNIGKEKEMDGEQKERRAGENGNLLENSLMKRRIEDEENDPNGNAPDATDLTRTLGDEMEDADAPDLEQQYHRAHHQEILSQQQDLIIATQSAQALLDKQSPNLSPAEKAQLQRDVTELRGRYETTLSQAEQQMKQLQTVQEELQKFSHESDTFETWLQEAHGQMEDLRTPAASLDALRNQLQRQKSFSEDVISHRGDLRFVSISGQKVLDAAEVCASGGDGLPATDMSGTCAAVRERLDSAAARYKTLHTECNQLGQKLRDVVENLRRFDGTRGALSLQAQTTSHQATLETLRRAAETLLSSDRELLSNPEHVQESTDELVERYESLSKTVGERQEKLQVTLTRSLSVQDGLDEMMSWMERVEEKVKRRPAVMLSSCAVTEVLSKEVALEQEMLSRQSSVSAVRSKLEQFVESADPAAAALLQKQMESLSRSFTDALELQRRKVLQLEELRSKLEEFEKSSEKMQEFVNRSSQADVETPGKNMKELSQLLQDSQAELLEKEKDLEALHKLSVELTRHAPEGSGAPVLNKMKNISDGFSALKQMLTERASEVWSCQNQLQEFRAAAGGMMKWLKETRECAAGLRLEPGEHALRTELQKTNDLLAEWTSRSAAVQDVSRRGSAVCRLIRALASPAQTKRRHSSGLVLSNGSDTGNHIDLTNQELKLVEQDVSSLNKDYEDLGLILRSRLSEIGDSLKNVQAAREETEGLLEWMEEAQKKAASSGNRAVKSQLEQQKVFEESLKEKQQQLQTLREKLLKLIEEHPDSPDAELWRSKLAQIDAGWEQLRGSVEIQKQHLEESSRKLELLQTSGPQLEQWLEEKERMLGVLGPLSAQPHMLITQKQQVQILLQEFDSRKPQFEELKEVVASALSSSEKQDPAAAQMKQQLAAITLKWQDLTSQLSERHALIQQGVEKSTQFQNLLQSLSKSATCLETELNNQQPLSSQPEEVQRQIQATSSILTQLRGEKKRLQEADSICSELLKIVTEEYLRADLTKQLETINKPFRHLEDKTADGAAQLAFASSQQFHQTSKDFQTWLNQTLQEQSSPKPISAHVEMLKQSLQEISAVQKAIRDHEDPYQTIIKEGDALLQSTEGAEKVALQGQLSALRSNWEDVKRSSSERAEKLKEAKLKAEKYQEHAENLSSWLKESEDRERAVKLSTNLMEIEEALSELKAIQKDVDKHGGQVVMMNSCADSLLEIITRDGDAVREEKLSIGKRVDKLSEDVTSRRESLQCISQKLKEFNDLKKEAKGQLESAQKHLDSVSCLGVQAYTSKNLTSMKAQQNNLETLHNQIEHLKNSAQTLVADASEAEGVTDLLLEADGLEKDHSWLSRKIQDVCSTLESKLQGIGQFQNSIREMFANFADMDDDLDGMPPVGRDLVTLREQQAGIQNFVEKLQDLINSTVDAKDNCKRMLDSEASPDLLGLKRDLETLGKQCGKLMDRATGRREQVEETLHHLKDFYCKTKEFNLKLDSAEQQEESQGSVGLETEVINQQLESFKKIRATMRSCDERDEWKPAVLWFRQKMQGLSLFHVGEMGKPLSRPDCLRQNPSCVSKGDEEDLNIDDCYVPQRSIYDTVRLNEQINSGSKGSLSSRHFVGTLPYSHRTLDVNVLCGNGVLTSSSAFELRGREERVVFDSLKRSGDIIRGAETMLCKPPGEKAEHRRSWRTFAPPNLGEFGSEMLCINATEQRGFVRVGRSMTSSLTSEGDSGLCSPTVEREQRNSRAQKRTGPSTRSLSSAEGMRLSGDLKTEGSLSSGQEEFAFSPVRNRLPASVYYTPPFGSQQRNNSRDLSDGLQASHCDLNGLTKSNSRTRILTRLSGYEELPTTELLEDTSKDNPELHSVVVTEPKTLPRTQKSHMIKDEKCYEYEQRATESKMADLEDFLLLVERGVSFSNGLNHIIDEDIETLLTSITEGSRMDLEVSPSEKLYQKDVVESLQSQLQELNSLGQALIQNAPKGTSTGNLDRDLEVVNTRWNTLNKKVTDRSAQLHEALLRCGRFQDALESLLSWLTDTEELVANQKPPSAEFKVVKAQIQEQKLLQRLLDERRPTVELIQSEGRRLTDVSGCVEKQKIGREVESLAQRWSALLRKAESRHKQLQNILGVAQQFHETFEPLSEWLTATEKKLANSEPIGTQTPKLQEQISQHKSLEEEVQGRGKLLHQAMSMGQSLRTLSSVEDRDLVQTKLDLTHRVYLELQEACEKRAELLRQALANARIFGEDEVALMTWLDEVHGKLSEVTVPDYAASALHKRHAEQLALHEDIERRRQSVDQAVLNGLELLKHTTGEEVVLVQGKLDEIKQRYSEIRVLSAGVSHTLERALSLALKLKNSQQEMNDWMEALERELESFDAPQTLAEQLSHSRQRLAALVEDLRSRKPLLDSVNEAGSALLELVPWRARENLDRILSDTNQRYQTASDTLTQRLEHTVSAIQKSLQWLTEAEQKLLGLGDILLEPEQASAQLQVQKSFSMDIMRHKDAVDEIVMTAEAISSGKDEAEKQKLRLNSERCLQLDRAQSLSAQFWETHEELWPWLQETRTSFSQLSQPAIEHEALREQQEELRQMRELIAEHKPHIDKMNKTGPQLVELSPAQGAFIREKQEEAELLYTQLRADVKIRAATIDEAISKSTQFHDKMSPLLESLERCAERLRRPLSVSVELEKIREQIGENKTMSVELEKLQPAYEMLRRGGEEMIQRSLLADTHLSAKAVQEKLDQMVFLWSDIQALLEEREAKLLDVLELAEKFWCDHCALVVTIRDTQELLKELEEPGVDPSVVKQQQEALEGFREEIDGLQDELNVVQNLGAELMTACGEPDKPVIKKSVDEVNSAWETLNKAWKERVETLEEAMQAAVLFQDSLQNMFDSVDIMEAKLDSMSAVGTDLETVKQQMEELKEFKSEAYQLQIEMERLNHQAGLLLKKVLDEEQRSDILEPIGELKMLWENLDHKIISRQHKLEGALLALGQFQHALDELLSWLSHTEDLLSEQRETCGDPKAIEIQLAKHHVLQNDVLAHKSTVEAVNKAGGELIDSSAGEEARSLQVKLENLNQRWRSLLGKTEQRRKLLDSALLQAQGFHGEIEDLQQWLKDTERQLLSSKPLGGLPDTAREQLDTHLELCSALEVKEEIFQELLQRGQQILVLNPEAQDSSTEGDLRNLQEKWTSVQTKAGERKVKLEEALAMASDFHNSLQDFINWLTQAEQTLNVSSPASLILENISFQIDEHKVFVTEVNSHRDQIMNLDKTGTHLKYFAQKQDVVLIKNLLLSVQSRWEKLLQRSLERGRLLDEAKKRAKQFHESWSKLMEWLQESERALDTEMEIANDPDKIKLQLSQHKEFQRALGSKHAVYDSTGRTGRALKDRSALQDDTQKLEHMLSELRDQWDTLCGKSVERQNKLEEALLISGQFTDALQALIDWLYKVEPQLAEDQPVHGDIDLVLNLIHSHKVFQKELGKRTVSVQALKRSARELTESSHHDSSWVKAQMQELSARWESVCSLSVSKQSRLQQALAQSFTPAFTSCWSGWPKPNRVFASTELFLTTKMPSEFLKKLEEQRLALGKASSMGENILSICHPDSNTTIKHWITIIKARFEEVTAWARQHQQRLSTALDELLANQELLENLLTWLQWAERTLGEKDKESLPLEIEEVKALIAEHQTFMEEMTRKQPDVDKVTKTHKRKAPADSALQSQIPVPERGRASRKRSPTQSLYAAASQAQTESKNPRVKLLVSKWQQVWLLALDRRRKLNDALDRLEELKEFANFDFDVWRKRYMRWMNHKKSRVMDFFRRIDKDQDGKVTRQEFIEGILSSKFPTSRLEMSAVADIFDRDGDGYIDYYEFVAALHPNKEAYKPLTDADKIEDEVTRQVAKCKCPKRFQVEQIGANKYRQLIKRLSLRYATGSRHQVQLPMLSEAFLDINNRENKSAFELKCSPPAALLPAFAHYLLHNLPALFGLVHCLHDSLIADETIANRDSQNLTPHLQVAVLESCILFGDSQQLRLVRILRSTVMVRVGGGWMALDEFLVKNDPCRVHHHGSKMLRSESNSSITQSPIGWQLSHFLSLLHPSAKGRTNVELREKFILPEGTTQVMASFRYRGRRSRPSSRGASPNRSNTSQSCTPQPNHPGTGTPKQNLTRNYDKPWLVNSKPAAALKSSDSFESQGFSSESTPIQGSKLRLPGYLSGKGFQTVEDGALINAAVMKARAQALGSSRIPSRPGSKPGSRGSSRRGSDASDFDISDIQSVCSDASETVMDSGRPTPRSASRQHSGKPSKIPTPQRRSTPTSKLAKSSKR